MGLRRSRWGRPQGDTVYLAAADEDLMVSLIQSNFPTSIVRVMLTLRFWSRADYLRAGDSLISASEPRADGLALAW
ncbi:MAG: hypothetical protein ACUVRV_09380 [Cyanobacteriota bacterium]